MTSHSLFHNVVRVDLKALEHNFSELRRLSPHPRKIIAVVKADAYGHGLIPVARRLARIGCEAFAVFRMEEAVLLREAGVSAPIQVLMGVLEEECEAAVEFGVTPVVYDWDSARLLNEAALARGKILDVHVKVDTGMGRLGIPDTEAVPFLEKLPRLSHLNLHGLLTHLSAAEDPAEMPYTEEQIRRFKQILATAHGMGYHPILNHVSNSAACLGCLDTGAEWVRPGLALYGSMPSPLFGDRVRLKPVMSFHSRVIQVKRVPAGTSISYSRTYITDRPTTIASIPVGYDDGYFRAFSNRSQLLIRGRRAPVRGLVCMNLTMAEVDHIPGVQAGDPVVLLGPQQEERITAEELAGLMDTVSYEIYTSFGAQNPRLYVEDGEPADLE